MKFTYSGSGVKVVNDDIHWCRRDSLQQKAIALPWRFPRQSVCLDLYQRENLALSCRSVC